MLRYLVVILEGQSASQAARFHGAIYRHVRIAGRPCRWLHWYSFKQDKNAAGKVPVVSRGGRAIKAIVDASPQGKKAGATAGKAPTLPAAKTSLPRSRLLSAQPPTDKHADLDIQDHAQSIPSERTNSSATIGAAHIHDHDSNRLSIGTQNGEECGMENRYTSSYSSYLILLSLGQPALC